MSARWPSAEGRARGFALRAGVAAGLLLLLGGPTPGAVGSCGGANLDRAADLASYCKERDQLVCVRRQLRKEISIAASNDCRRQAIAQCEMRSWAPGCQPTVRQTRACLNALRSLDTLQTKENQIAECKVSALCSGGAATTPRDAGSRDAGLGQP